MKEIVVEIYREKITRELDFGKDSLGYKNIVLLHFPRDLLIEHFGVRDNELDSYLEDCTCDDTENLIQWLSEEDKEKTRKELIEYLKEC